MQAADKSVITPIIYSNEYIPFLLDYCKANNISLVIPLFDIDLPVLAANREKFHAAGVTLLVSDENFVRTCNDKWSAYNFLKAKIRERAMSDVGKTMYLYIKTDLALEKDPDAL